MIWRALFCFALAAACAIAATPTSAENKLKALFEIVLDLDNDGKMDRAVLVGIEGTGFYPPDKEWFMFGASERVDLYIYLGTGDEMPDLSRKPAFLKKGIATGERRNQVFPLESSGARSLIVKSAYNLFSNWAEETLTVVHRKGEFLVAAWSYSFETKRGEQGDCEIDYLSGKGAVSKGLDGKKKPLKGKLAPVKLGAWSAEKYLKACKFGRVARMKRGDR